MWFNTFFHIESSLFSHSIKLIQALFLKLTKLNSWLLYYYIWGLADCAGGGRVFQNRALQVVFNLPFKNHTNNFFIENLILKVPDAYVHTQAVLFLFQNGEKCNQDSCITHSIKPLSCIHNHDTRNSLIFNIPQFNHSTFLQSFTNPAVGEWNTLLIDIINTNSSNFFSKSSLKCFTVLLINQHLIH